MKFKLAIGNRYWLFWNWNAVCCLVESYTSCNGQICYLQGPLLTRKQNSKKYHRPKWCVQADSSLSITFSSTVFIHFSLYFSNFQGWRFPLNLRRSFKWCIVVFFIFVFWSLWHVAWECLVNARISHLLT